MMSMPQRMHPVPSHASSADASSSAGRLVSTDGRSLPLRATSIETRASGGVARVVLKQRFENPYDEPLAVRYQVPLPADGAVSGFAFQLGDRRIVGEVDTKKEARARYETALVEGKSAAILEQDRSSSFTQDVGNIPPKSEIIAEIQIDQKLRWLAEGAWEWRFPTVVAPRFSGAEGRVADVDRLSVDVAADELDVRVGLALAIVEDISGRPESPSHAITTTDARGETRVALRAAGARLDRDVVVRWPVATAAERVQLAVARPHARHPHERAAYGLLTVVPPAALPARDVARDLVLLIDTSGSMHGEPLAQARRVCLALVDSLDPDDQLEMIEFSWRPTRWKQGAVPATDENKKSARKWLADLAASGGTEMREGILAALAPLRAGAQRQVIIISDGLIGFESEIVRAIADRLPAGCRVHTVGVGSSVNRSLTAPAARAGRGVEAVIGIGEDAERAAARLVAHTAAPVVIDLEVAGSAVRRVAPERVPDLMGGAPALVALELDPAGGSLIVRGTTATGTWTHRLEVPPAPPHGSGPEFAVPLFARERIEDLEISRASGAATGPIDAEVEQLGLAFQIATRLTSWVAVTEEATVDPTAPSRRERMPHELPYGMSVQMLGLRGAAPSVQSFGAPAPAMVRSRSAPMPRSPRRESLGGSGRVAAPPPPAAPPAAGAPPPPPGGAPASTRDLESYLRVEPLSAEQDEAADDSEEASPVPARQAQEERAQEKKKSLGERVADGLRRMLRRDLRGEIIVHEAARIVVSIEVAGAFRWEPTEVVLELSDGSEIEVQIIAELTTRPADASDGQVLRLAVSWTSGSLAAAPRRFRVTTPTDSLTVAV